jgi:site-specific recombinase XerD
MKIQRVKIADHQYIWLVLDNNYLPIEPIEIFIRYLHCTEKSPDTIQSYASHLKIFWEYLEYYNKDWLNITIADFADFVHWLRNHSSHLKDNTEKRKSERTVNTILSALSSFYRYHNQLGNTQIQLTEPCYLPVNRYKSLLHHVYKHKPTWKRIVGLKPPKMLPKTLTSEQISCLIQSCRNPRDRFLISLLYETGLRIGQALSLRHVDIKSWDNEIHVIFRQHNENQARNKSRLPNILHVSQKLMQLYSTYLQAYLSEPNEYVFIDTLNKEPLCYGAVKKIFSRLSKRVGFYVTPHMLRHTHATDLIKSGWDSAWVQKRLGHANVQTTIDTYTHIGHQDLKQAFQIYQSKKKEISYGNQ